jgi:6-phosphogluconolactonase
MTHAAEPLHAPHPDRRQLLLAGLGLAMSAQAISQSAGPEAAAKEPIELLASGYSTQGNEGIYRLRFDPVSGTLGPPELLVRADNPSWLLVAGQRVHAANELAEGRLSTYALAADGSLSLLGSTLTLGGSPCFVALSPDRRFVATANYSGGNFSVFALDRQGVAKAGPQVLRHPSASGAKSSHAHWLQWSAEQDFIYTVDLGLNEVNVFPFDSQTGRAGAGRLALQLQAGDGPRHLFFHPKLAVAYVLNELSNTITVAERQAGGGLVERQRIATLPPDFKSRSQAAHIHVSADGKHLYASNRGHNSIAVFSINATDGRLSLLQIEPVQGHWPRIFLLLEAQQVLMVANQESKNIVLFKLAADGTLKPTGQQVNLPQVSFLGQVR